MYKAGKRGGRFKCADGSYKNFVEGEVVPNAASLANLPMLLRGGYLVEAEGSKPSIDAKPAPSKLEEIAAAPALSSVEPVEPVVKVEPKVEPVAKVDKAEPKPKFRSNKRKKKEGY